MSTGNQLLGVWLIMQGASMEIFLALPLVKQTAPPRNDSIVNICWSGCDSFQTVLVGLMAGAAGPYN